MRSLFMTALKGVAILLGVVVALLLAGVLFLGFTPPGARIVAGLIETYASSPDQTIRITGPGALLTGDFRAETITLSDTKGVYAEIRDVELAWSPTALFSGRFKAELLRAGAVEVARAPVVTEPAPAEPSSGFSLPVEVQLDRFELQRIALGAPLIGSAQVLAAEGTLTATSASIAAKINASQPDRPEARALADFIYDPAGNALRLEASIDEPKGGLLAKALRLPNDPAVTIRVTGDGPLSKWTGTATAALDGTEVLKLDGEHTLSADGYRTVRLTGGGSISDLLPEPFRPLFAGRTTIDLATAFEGSTAFKIDRGRLSTDAVTIDASGTLSTVGQNDLRARIAGVNGPAPLSFPLSGETATLLIGSADLSLVGDARSAVLDVKASVPRAVLPQGTIDNAMLSAHSDAFNLTDRRGRIIVSLTAGSTTLELADINRLIRGPLSLDGTLDVTPQAIGFAPLTLDTTALDATITGRYSLIDGTLGIDLDATAPAAALPPAAARRVGGPVALKGRLETATDGTLTVSNLALDSPALQATGGVTFGNGQLTADLSGTIPNIAPLVANGTGAASVTAQIAGPLDALSLKAEVRSDAAELAGKSVTGLVITADTVLKNGLPEGTATVNGTVEGQALSAQAKLAVAEGALSIPSLQAKVGENTVTGALAFTPDFQPSGTFDFALPDIAPLAAIAGQTAAGDLTGHATITSENGKTGLAINATGGSLTRGDLSVTNPRADVTITDLATLNAQGRITADSAAQGANRVDNAVVDLSRQGEETQLALTGTYDKAPLSLQGRIATGPAGPSVTVDQLAVAPRGIPLELSSPKQLVFEGGGVRLDGFEIGLPGGTATVTGLVGETLDAVITVRGNPAVEYATPMAGGEARVAIASADITAKGRLDAAAIDAKARLAYVATPQARLEGLDVTATSERLNITGREGQIRATVKAESTRFVSADLGRLLPGPLTLQTTLGLTPDAVTFDPATIDSAGLDGAVNGRFQLSDGSLRATFRATAPPSALPPAAASRLATDARLAGSVTRAADGTLNVANLALDSGSIAANGSLTLANDQITAALAGTLPDLGRLLPDAKGTARFSIDATGALARPLVKAEIRSNGATLAGRTLADLVAAATVTADPANPSAEITATGTLDRQVIDLRSTVASTEGRIRIPALNLRVGPNVVDGAIELTDSFLPNGEIRFTLPDISLLAALAGQRAEGDLAGNATITSQGERTALSLKAQGSGIRRDGLAIVKPDIDLTIDDLKTLTLRGRLNVQEIIQGQNRVTGLRLDLEQPAQNRTELALTGTYDKAPLAANATITSQNGTTRVDLSSFSAAPRGIALRLARPTTITLENGGVRLTDLQIGASGGTVTVTGTAGERLDMAVRLDRLPASLANTIQPSLGAQGTISGRVDAKGTTAAPDIAYDLRWAEASVAQARSAGVGALAIAAKGRFANNSLTVDTTLSGSGGLSFRGGGSLGLSGNRPIDMRFAGDLPFGILGPILAQQGFLLTGSATVDVAVGGSVAAPAVTGRISTSGARLVDARRNQTINAINAEVALEGQQARIVSLTGRLATGGSLAVSGTIGTAPASGFPANLDIRLDRATYVDGSLVTANLSGALTLTGPLTGSPLLSGRVDVPKASITVPQKLPASLSEIDIRHRNAPPEVRRMLAKLKKDEGNGGATKKSGGIGFDLTVSAARIFVRGRGIDAELGGDLTIRGNAATPIVNGGFQMKRGRLEVLGRRIDFTDGSIAFGGDLIPTLDLDATSTVNSTTITVNVAGLANNPQVNFSSAPALPQDEILAQLIFNRSLSNLSPVQIAQLAAAVSQLAGGSGGTLFDGLRNKLGVDDLDISTDAAGGASVRAGRYLNDRTYLELQSGTEAGGGKAVINLDVGRGVKLRGEAGGDGAGAGVFYEKEY